MTTIDVCKVLRDDHAELAILRDRANDYIKRGKRFDITTTFEDEWRYITYRFYNDDVVDDIDDLK